MIREFENGFEFRAMRESWHNEAHRTVDFDFDHPQFNCWHNA
jgi:hypothetical protein